MFLSIKRKTSFEGRWVAIVAVLPCHIRDVVKDRGVVDIFPQNATLCFTRLGMLNQNTPLRRGAVKKGCKLRVTTIATCTSERV